MQIINKKIHGKESREKMLEAVKEVADVIGSTMSAKGRNVILEQEYGSPMIVNDGVTVLNELFSDDPVKNAAIQILKDAANRTNHLAGDGTSGTTVLAYAILKAGWKQVEEGANPVILRRQIEAAAKRIEDKLKKSASEVLTEQDAINIATVSVQDSELGQKIGSLLFKIGKNGAVTIKNSIKQGVQIEHDAGMRIQGAINGGIIESQDRWETKIESPKVLILEDSPEDHEFESKWLPFLQNMSKKVIDESGQQKMEILIPRLIIIAEKLSRRLSMSLNQNKDKIKWFWFRPSSGGKNMKEIYKDIQAMVGGKIVNEEEGVFLNRLSFDDLGSVENAVGGRYELVFTVSPDNLADNRYVDRMNAVKEQITNTDEDAEQEQIKERYANLTGGVAVIKVSAATERDTEELKLRIEDAVNATRVSMEEGYVAGGGVALYNAARLAFEGIAKDQGAAALVEASEAIMRQILANAGCEDIDVLVRTFGYGEGMDVLTNTLVDMKKSGIIDPLKVVRLALSHAVSVSGLLLTTEYCVTNVKDDVEKVKEFFKG